MHRAEPMPYRGKIVLHPSGIAPGARRGFEAAPADLGRALEIDPRFGDVRQSGPTGRRSWWATAAALQTAST